jgi:hypothetical protein
VRKVVDVLTELFVKACKRQLGRTDLELAVGKKGRHDWYLPSVRDQQLKAPKSEVGKQKSE